MHLHHQTGEEQVWRVCDVQDGVVCVFSSVLQVRLHHYFPPAGLQQALAALYGALMDTRRPRGALIAAAELPEAQSNLQHTDAGNSHKNKCKNVCRSMCANTKVPNPRNRGPF